MCKLNHSTRPRCSKYFEEHFLYFLLHGESTTRCEWVWKKTSSNHSFLILTYCVLRFLSVMSNIHGLTKVRSTPGIMYRSRITFAKACWTLNIYYFSYSVVVFGWLFQLSRCTYWKNPCAHIIERAHDYKMARCHQTLRKEMDASNQAKLNVCAAISNGFPAEYSHFHFSHSILLFF